MMPYRVPMVRLERKFQDREDELIESTHRVLRSGRYIGGNEVAHFEEELAHYLGVDAGCVISCANGSDALFLALASLDFPPQSEVIIATHNYVAAVEAAYSCHLIPVWADTQAREEGNPVSFQISSDEAYLDSLKTERTVAIVAVNIYGTPYPYEALRAYCDKNHLILIEDNAQGMGGKRYSTLDGLQPLGIGGDASITSFFPTKPLGGCGDGGALIIPKDRAWAERAREKAKHGQVSLYEYRQIGCNSRLDALQAAWLRVQLRYLDRDIQNKNIIASRYDQAFAGLPQIALERFAESQYGAYRALYQYTLCVPSKIRDLLILRLAQEGIESRIYYPQMLHQIEAYKPYSRQGKAGCPHADQISQSMLSLPIDPLQTSQETQWVIDSFALSYQTLYSSSRL